jgi:predicted Zn-dependent protease with MMP-like domain
MPPARRIAFAAATALCAGLTAAALLGGFSVNPVVRAIETAGVIGLVAAIIFGGAIAIGLKLAGWEEPESEEEFEEVVLRSERLAASGLAADPTEAAFLELDPWDDEDFEELVREAMDDLPDLLRAALDRNVAVVVSDNGRRHRAYGLYQGDGATRDDYPDRIIIFRDTLRRDFGHDPDLLREQVTVTVRHELAHHIGFDELGVRDLGL